MQNEESAKNTTFVPLSVVCGTWNVNGTKTKETSIESLRNWLCPGNKLMVGSVLAVLV